MSSNGRTPATTVIEVVMCRMCGCRRALPSPRPRVWTFVCSGCGNTLQIDLDPDTQ